MRFVVFALTLACGPTPPSVLVPTSAALRPAVPRIPHVAPPTFPRVVSQMGEAVRMSFVHNHAEDDVVIRLQSRRGEDGGQAPMLTYLTARVLHSYLKARLPFARVQGGVQRFGAHVSISAHPDRLASVVRVLAEALRRPIDSEAVARTRRTLVRAFGAAGPGGPVADVHMGTQALIGHRATHDEPLRALRLLLAQYTSETVSACRAERFAPQNLEVLVSGPLSERQVFKVLRKHFASLPAGPEQNAASVPDLVPPEDAYIYSEIEGVDVVAVTLVQDVQLDSEEERPLYELFVHLLGGGFRSELNRTLREEHSYAYSAQAFVYELSQRETMAVRTAFEPDSAEDGLRELITTLDGLRTRTFSEGELNAGRARLFTALRAELDSAYGTLSVIAEAHARGLSVEDLEARQRALLEVSSADINAFAARHLDATRAILVLSGRTSERTLARITRDGTAFRIRP